MAVCGECGQRNPEEARFCLSCGTPLAERGAAGHEVRKIVTVVFADLAGSTGFGERLDPESLRRVQARFFDAMRLVLERHGATVEKFIGDAVMAVFGVPFVHEDDALRAVRASFEMREALHELNAEISPSWGVELTIRIGVNTGEVVAGDAASGQSFATGDTVNVAARLEQAADPGEILVGETTFRLVRDAVEAEEVDALDLRGRGEKVAARRLVSIRPDSPGTARRLETPLVGRENELRLLHDAFARVEREQGCHLFTLLGPAGVGKSRLVAEFLSGLVGRATSVRGRCLSYGDGITFWPVAEVVREAASLNGEETPGEARGRIAAFLADEDDAPLVAARVSELVGLADADAGGGEESFWAVRKFLEALARDEPLVVVLDDINWGEPTFLDLIEHIAEWSRGAPILLVCLARPELLDERPAWAGGKLNSTSLLLEPLNDEEFDLLVSAHLGPGTLEEDVRAQIMKVAEGNPLFVEETVALLLGQGLLTRENGHWTAVGLEKVPIPPTIQALLAARIDRLPAPERAVLERASVEGQVFHAGALGGLHEGRDGSARLVRALVRKELARPERSTFPGEEAFRFRHILIRDAAYESIPKETRAALHEQFADWLVDAAGARSLEYAEIVAYHLECAYRLRAQLGPVGEQGRALADEAAERLAGSAKRAVARNDMPGAATLYGRAVDLAAAGSPRIELLVAHARTLVELGELDAAEAKLRDAVQEAEAAGDRRLAFRARVEEQHLRLKTDPTETTDEVRQVAESSLPVFEELQDEAGLASAWDLLGQVHLMACRYELRAEALARALDHARRAGDEREDAILIGLGTAPYWGPTPVDECMERCQELLAEIGGQRPTVEAALVGTLAGLEAMRGNFDEARRLYARQQTMHEDLGLPYSLAAATIMAGRIEMLAGEPSAAEAELRRGYTILEGMGEYGVLSTLAAYLADAVYAQGRYDEADRLTHVSEESATSDDIASHVWWRVTRARVLARRGNHEEAERIGSEALALAEVTDDLFIRGRALTDLAEVRRLGETVDGSVPLLEEALRLFEAKGDTVSSGRTRAVLSAARAD
jgi:class 3 adenylate cyclase/tetratricopeptide (TPR) repeat protein